jgi:hypothetical protein
MAMTELAGYNPTTADVESCLLQLRTENVGGLLLVLIVVAEDGTPGVPFITIVALPSVATYIQPFVDNGVIFEDI